MKSCLYLNFNKNAGDSESDEDMNSYAELMLVLPDALRDSSSQDKKELLRFKNSHSQVNLNNISVNKNVLL